ncbi:hypothetical protein SAMD00019534_024080 [Acytostelium subglobosum LB1]|uniref:hypothetical protein n=1 Tax=Acytostelium subglobosum LB1 TaxID=1410327 RepID=UPI0006451875|nr:hypothetical protein SAMD00019534_024080 [Acytostelium subglobosum LB1]GAM19233.1 hypothetical protein SAMD00019534_024080 [Acytostelium subglobosum LB1]|eukprot:XP_012757160.1 hypothetical protein SAMD00019534_024080 [Acytostelium subglobosum LB1]
MTQENNNNNNNDVEIELAPTSYADDNAREMSRTNSDDDIKIVESGNLASTSTTTTTTTTTSSANKETKKFDDTPLPPKRSRLNPKFYSVDHVNETRLIAASMFYKFSFETLSPALSLIVLTRFESSGNSVTLLAVMNIVYFLMQSVGSILVGPFIRKFRPSRVTSMVFLMMFAITAFLLVLEAGYKGTVDKLGNWDRWLVTPVYIVMGLGVGMVEVSRKLVPRQILGNNPNGLAKINGLVHIFYEVCGTAGAFLSTVLIQKLGAVYAMVLMPPFFLVAAVIMFTITEPFPRAKEAIKAEASKMVHPVLSVLISIKSETANYFKTIGRGAALICNKDFWWIIPTYVVPQVLHRVLENILFPVFAKKVLKDGSLSGILTGGSNFGELLGALTVVKFGKYVKNPMWWVRIDGLCCSIVWVLVYPPAGVPIRVAATLIPCWIAVSSSWAAGDISLLSFLQSSFPLTSANDDQVKQDRLEELSLDTDDVSDIDDIEEINEDNNNNNGQVKYATKADEIIDEDDPAEGSPLASVIGFLFTCYAVIISGLTFGLGRVMDNYASQNNLQQGFFWIAGVGFTAAGFIAISASFLAKSPKFK